MSTLKVNTLTDTAATKSVPIEDVVNGTARAWVNFDGTFGTSPFTVANGGIRAAYNVSSVTDNGTGDYTINFTTAMPDANYCVTFGGTKSDAASRGGNFTAIDVNQLGTGNAPTTTSVRVRSSEGSTAAGDGSFINVFYFYVVIFR
jgi:hypothetical protein